MNRLLSLTLALALVVLSGCQNAPSSSPATDSSSTQSSSSQPSGSQDITPEGSGQPDASGSQPQQTVQSPFLSGTWLAKGGSWGDQYYFFNPDGSTGGTASLESGTGVSFTYEVSDTQVTFHMGSADNTQVCAIQNQGEQALTLVWEDGSKEELSYVSDQGAEDFQFYSNHDLCQMALRLCAQENGVEEDSLEVAAVTNEDGSVSIQVYQNLGDHNSTAAWYTVDRFTAQGRNDSTGEPVDLSQS